MAYDRFIRFVDAADVPTMDALRDMCLPYFGTSATLSTNEDQPHRLFFTLLGKSADAWAREERFVEIVRVDDSDVPHLDVITREADGFTNAIADGLVTRLTAILKTREVRILLTDERDTL